MADLLDKDGNVYTTVVIGSQEWIVENLRTTHYGNGDAIPNLTVNEDWAAEDGTSGHDGAYCWYDNNQGIYGDYGLLYNKYAVDNTAGLCYFTRNGVVETGWRICTFTDMYDTLGDVLGGASAAGQLMKEAGTDHWASGNTGTNASGFTGLGSGQRINEGTFISILESIYFWLGDQDGVTILNRAQNGIGTASMSTNKRYGCSVRCVREYVPSSTTIAPTTTPMTTTVSPTTTISPTTTQLLTTTIAPLVRGIVISHQVPTRVTSEDLVPHVVFVVNPGISDCYEFIDMFISASYKPISVLLATDKNFTDPATVVASHIKAYNSGWYHISTLPRTAGNKVLIGKLLFVKVSFDNQDLFYDLKLVKTGYKAVAGG